MFSMDHMVWLQIAFTEYPSYMIWCDMIYSAY